MGSDFQRTLMWVILAASCFMLWDNWQVYNGKPSFFGTPQVEQKEVAKSQNPANTPATVPEVQGSGAEAVAKGMIKADQPVVVSSDLLKINIDEQGAVVTRAELLKERQEAEWTEVGLAGMILGRKAPENKNIVLFNVSANHVYVAQSGLIGGDFPNHKSAFKYIGTQVTKATDPDLKREVNVTRATFESVSGNVKLEKTYELIDGHYGINVIDKVTNLGSNSVNPSVYYQLTRDGSKPEGESSFYYTYTGPAIYTEEDKFKKIAFDDIGDQPNHQVKTKQGWIAMIQHYFVSAWVDAKKDSANPQEFYTTKLSDNLYAVGSISRLGAVEPGKSAERAALLYVGPQNQQRLQYIADGLELVVDYGWLTFLAKPIYSLLYFLNTLVHNWGWSIVLLTCLVKAILYPISAAGYKSMARMKEVTPRMKALQEQYGNDKQAYQKAMMDLYKKEKINPVGGCLPIALQIPVFLALYWVLLASVELRGSEWIFWVKDLAMPDPWFILPLVMMLTMFLQMKLNPTPTDPMQAKMMMIMPLVFGVMFFFFASGLVLYWLTNNVLSILQQWYVNKAIAKERQQRIKAANAKFIDPEKTAPKKK